ncbi:MAG: hypothetical protein JWQ14_2051 [Adhaeribacter sp.]|nr:hypothetical protein [Adhaeribacter sp.]
MANSYSRRNFIYKFLASGTAFLGGSWLLNSCTATQAVAQNATATTNGPTTIFQNAPKPPQQGQPKPGQTGNEKANSQEPCDDLTGVPASEIDKRKKLAYVNKSPIPESKCGNCNLYLPPGKDKACGGCMLFKGPVRAEGYCTYWAPIS